MFIGIKGKDSKSELEVRHEGEYPHSTARITIRSLDAEKVSTVDMLVDMVDLYNLLEGIKVIRSVMTYPNEQESTKPW